MKLLNKLLLYLVLPIVVLLGAVAAVGYQWVTRPLELPSAKVDLLVPAGATPATIARLLNQAGVQVNSGAFAMLARATELDKKLKAGGYQIARGDSVWDVLRRIALGEVTSRQITIVEGWTLRQVRAAILSNPDIKKSDPPWTDQEVPRLIQGGTALKSYPPEGLLFPDTYIFSIGTPDTEIVERAARTQQRVLEKAWQVRQEGLPLRSPYEALILASIVEKETGKASDRARIAGVFINRLRLNMPLQTDPTVIYGLGEAYTGRLRKVDLQTDTPWNTYTRNGLPPTPIASTGLASLQAALQPEKHDYLYFVAKGDGTSAFAKTLPEHNRNVAQYILGRKP
ncbi:endolytic transglycosylase MltG [Alcaligenaceae bacterium LF4-65]|jgi:UPF0755 protein|uniref:Endolytic murein transglycosylase n=1 Tax=Zwartia hollandica TaxID=324606 RepID=A0A953T5U4_9BURK|nr:endolytic transglycosylase MltG [Zwartia hollandica]MBZ1349189.1 endolytic transglycosylase MltG [Zwartia hollandica]